MHRVTGCRHQIPFGANVEDARPRKCCPAGCLDNKESVTFDGHVQRPLGDFQLPRCEIPAHERNLDALPPGRLILDSRVHLLLERDNDPPIAGRIHVG